MKQLFLDGHTSMGILNCTILFMLHLIYNHFVDEPPLLSDR